MGSASFVYLNKEKEKSKVYFSNVIGMESSVKFVLSVVYKKNILWSLGFFIYIIKSVKIIEAEIDIFKKKKKVDKEKIYA